MRSKDEQNPPESSDTKDGQNEPRLPPDLQAAVDRIVAAAPPLTQEQIERLRLILQPGCGEVPREARGDV